MTPATTLSWSCITAVVGLQYSTWSRRNFKSSRRRLGRVESPHQGVIDDNPFLRDLDELGALSLLSLLSAQLLLVGGYGLCLRRCTRRWAHRRRCARRRRTPSSSSHAHALLARTLLSRPGIPRGSHAMPRARRHGARVRARVRTPGGSDGRDARNAQTRPRGNAAHRPRTHVK